MWSLRCLLIGHDDMLLRRPYRLSLQCRHCGRETHGWNLNRPYQEGTMNKWVQFGASIPVVGTVGWAMVRFFEWRRKLRAYLSRTTPDEG